MKKASALWGGTALLIELVILILALVRGDWMIPLLLAVFAGWSLWLIFTQLLPVWKNNRAYRKNRNFGSNLWMAQTIWNPTASYLKCCSSMSITGF